MYLRALNRIVVRPDHRNGNRRLRANWRSSKYHARLPRHCGAKREGMVRLDDQVAASLLMKIFRVLGRHASDNHRRRARHAIRQSSNQPARADGVEYLDIRAVTQRLLDKIE